MANNLKNLSETDRKKIADSKEILKGTQTRPGATGSGPDAAMEPANPAESCPKGWRWDAEAQTCVPE